MTYIWNRADRVPEIYMPEAIKVAFKKWVNKKNKQLNNAIENNDLKTAKKLRNRIKHQEENYSGEINRYKYRN